MWGVWRCCWLSSSLEIVKNEMLVYIKKSSRTVLEAPAQVEDEEECWFTLMQS